MSRKLTQSVDSNLWFDSSESDTQESSYEEGYEEIRDENSFDNNQDDILYSQSALTGWTDAQCWDAATAAERDYKEKVMDKVSKFVTKEMWRAHGYDMQQSGQSFQPDALEQQ